jgi:mRNA interferase RelE/StbE
MTSYKVVLKPSVEKDLRSLPKATITHIFQHIEKLKDEPYPRQSIKLSGAEHLYRLRVGDYRIIYSIAQEEKQIIVHYVRHRRDVYRKL